MIADFEFCGATSSGTSVSYPGLRVDPPVRLTQTPERVWRDRSLFRVKYLPAEHNLSFSNITDRKLSGLHNRRGGDSFHNRYRRTLLAAWFG